MLFDGHGDVWTDVTCKRVDHNETDIFRKYHLKKFQAGKVTGGIFVIWIDPPYDQDPPARSKQIVESIKAEMIDSADLLNFVTKFDDFEKGTKAGKINVVTGIEGLSQIGEDIDMIDYFYNEVGARHAMLTWNELNALATGCPQDPTRGLTEAGKRAVKRMEKLGMVLDVSHLNDKSFWDLMSIATTPVIASHSNSRTVCPAKRNLTDDMLKEIAKTGGLVGMNSLREFVSEKREEQNVQKLCDHLEKEGYMETSYQSTLHPSASPKLSLGERNMTSVKDCGLLLERIYRGECVSEEASEQMLELLKKQENTTKIPAGIKDEVETANKTGETDEDQHDIAIVYGAKTTYVLCVMSEGWKNSDDAVENIRNISSMVYNYLNL